MPAAANEVIKNRLAIANLFFYWIGSVLRSFKCLLELIPEGIHCIDREIDWLLQNGAAHETVTKFGNNT